MSTLVEHELLQRSARYPEFMSQTSARARDAYTGLSNGDEVELHEASGAVLQVGPIHRIAGGWAGRIGAITSPSRYRLRWTLGEEVRFREQNVFLVVR